MKIQFPFNLSLSGTIAVLVFIGLIVAGLALHKCHAASPFDVPYAQFSLGGAAVRGPTEVLDLQFMEPSNIVPHSFWQFGMTAIGESTFKGLDYNNNLVFRGLFCDGFGPVDVGIGIAYMTNYLPYNGGNINANLQIDYRFRKWPITLTYTHFSDAGSKLPNYGRDVILVGWRFH